MKLAGSYAFEAPKGTVWAALFDPEVLAKTLPGCEKLEREGDTFKGEINVKMGPVQGKFQGKVDISDVKELEGYTMVVDGRGPAGFVKANARLGVIADGESTRLEYDSDIQVGGKIASVGQRLLDASSRAIVKQSLEGLHQQIKALAARRAEEAASSAPPAPSPTGTIGDEPPDDDGWPSSDPPEAEATPFGFGSPGEPAASVAPEAPKPRPAAPPVAASPNTKPKTSAVASAPSTSQAAFVLGVAKEVTKELFPMRTVLLIVAALIVLGLIYYAVR